MYLGACKATSHRKYKKCSKLSIYMPFIYAKSACWWIESDNMHSALYHNSNTLSKSTKMDEVSDSNNVQYYCDLEIISSSKRKGCQRFQFYTNCQKPSFRDRTMMENVKTIYITAILILFLVHGKFETIVYRVNLFET